MPTYKTELIDPSLSYTVLQFEPRQANYTFQSTIDGVTYTFGQRWNQTMRDGAGLWIMDVMAEDETPIVMGIPLVLGAALGRRSTHQLFQTGVIQAFDLSGEHREAAFEDLGQRVEVRRFTIEQALAASGLKRTLVS